MTLQALDYNCGFSASTERSGPRTALLDSRGMLEDHVVSRCTSTRSDMHATSREIQIRCNACLCITGWAPTHPKCGRNKPKQQTVALGCGRVYT